MRKKCKNCGTRFETNYPFQICCDNKCFKEHMSEVNAKKKEKQLAKLKEQPKKIPKQTPIRSQSNNERAKLIRTLTSIFNAYIRERDKDLPCISCGVTHAVWHAGHYKTTKAFPELRFNEDNVHKQCEKCNIELGGNIIQYRKNLILRIGQERVEALESYQPPIKLTVIELKELIALYKKKIS